MIGRACLSMLCLVFLAGCGGGSASMSKDQVQQGAWQWVKDQVGAKVSVDDPGCVDAGDGRWKCLTTVRAAEGAAQQVSLSVTCDAESCLYEPG